MPQLILQSDIEEYRPLNFQLGKEVFETVIRRASSDGLKRVLGIELYSDFITKYDQSEDPDYNKYQNLLNGSTYLRSGKTIKFDGLKQYLRIWCYFELIKQARYQLSKSGLIHTNTEEASRLTQAEQNAVLNEIYIDAVSYESEIDEFLTNQSDIYPLYDGNNW